MRKLFVETLRFLDDSFRRLEALVPPPLWEEYEQGLRARYQERTVPQALIQKLFRQISGLHALDVLLLNGLTQEQGIIQRVLDEIGEDIQFLGLAFMKGEQTALHDDYLADFWAEEFDHVDPLQATQKRRTIRREKIHGYIARTTRENDAERVKRISRSIHKTYSGFVHAASSHIMDMCGGDPPRFHFMVPSNDPRMLVHIEDAWNYFYRSLLSLGVVAMALQDWKLVDELYAFLEQFEQRSGTSHSEGFRKARSAAAGMPLGDG